jgi:D-glycero-D-manno-heptose 1,7-bisphosphate phosphatase
MARSEETRAVFFDRDGVLNEAIIRDSKPYPPSTLAEVKIFDGAFDSLDKIRSLGYKTFIITNQPDVSRGITSELEVNKINNFIQNRLLIDDVYTCFHDDADLCSCRKPLPGAILLLSKKFDINLEMSFMVGDRWRDIEAGKAANCKTVLIENSYDERKADNPDYVVKSLDEVAMLIYRLNRKID